MNSVYNIFFSPTGTTEKIGFQISKSFEGSNFKKINLTLATEQALNLSPSEIAIIGMPVHRGCLPEIAIKRFEKIKGNLECHLEDLEEGRPAG